MNPIVVKGLQGALFANIVVEAHYLCLMYSFKFP